MERRTVEFIEPVAGIEPLLRHYDVEEGAITIDGVDIRGLEQCALRRSFGTVPRAASVPNLGASLVPRPKAWPLDR